MMYYDDDIQFSDKYKNKMKTYAEAILENINNTSSNTNDIKSKRGVGLFAEEAFNVVNSTGNAANINNRFISFNQTIRSSLLTEALMYIYKRSTPTKFSSNESAANIMRSIVSEYVNNTGYENILYKMKDTSVIMSEMYNIITETADEVIDSVDKTNPDTFRISSDMKDEFFKQLNYSDSEAIETAIHDRVSTAMQDFINANTKDHEDISTALQQAQDNIEAVDTDSTSTDEEKEEMKEQYNIKAKRAINEIRNTSKSVFHSMVTSMCESVIKDQTSNAEFISEGRLDMDKIVGRVGLMYAFMEMLNTSKLENVNESFIKEIIDGLSA